MTDDPETENPEAFLEAFAAQRAETRRRQDGYKPVRVIHCSANGGNGHYILDGVRIDFDDIGNHLPQPDPDSLIPQEIVLVIEQSFGTQNPCPFCSDTKPS